jgi:protein-S-isoprenylcysteine O-methyltransferase Ste14
MENENKKKERVHVVLAHAYTFYLFCFLFGLFLDFYFPIGFPKNVFITFFGLIFIVFGSFLVFWAQKAGADFKKTQPKNAKAFFMGPYHYIRNPTHLGLFFLILGFGMTAGDVFIIVLSIIAFHITKTIFIKKEQEILEKKYGILYSDYKKIIKY